MYLIAIAWGYVALMMALAEATSSQGSVLGAIITFLIYGLLPLSILIYIMNAPARRKGRRRAELQAAKAAESSQGDGRDHTASGPLDALAPEGKEAP